MCRSTLPICNEALLTEMLNNLIAIRQIVEKVHTVRFRLDLLAFGHP
jgi:hypothetical protein